MSIIVKKGGFVAILSSENPLVTFLFRVAISCFSNRCDIILGGSVAEWLKAHDSKSCGRASVSEVRILSLPPLPSGSTQKMGLVSR